MPVWDAAKKKWIVNGKEYDNYTDAKNAAAGGGGAASGATPTAPKTSTTAKTGGGLFSTIASGVQGAITEGREAFNEANAAPGLSVTDLAKAVKAGNATPQDMLNALYATGKYTIETAETEMRVSGVQPPAREGSSGGAVSGSGSGTAKKTPAAPPDWLKGWVDAFQGLDDKQIIEAYYNGEEGLDRNVVGALLAWRNTKTDAKGVETAKWTEASLNRYLDQIDAQKPLGIKKADLAQQFDPSRADFGSRGTFGSGSLGQGNMEEGLFTPNSQGFGLVPASDQSGNLFPAAAVVNNQLYTPGDVARIAQQRGMKPGSTLSDIGMSLQQQNYMMDTYGADPARAMLATQVASGAYNPANQRIDPASGRPAGEMNDEALLRLAGEGVFRARGGPVKQGQPYIVGEKRPEVFVPEQDGTILPNANAAGRHNTISPELFARLNPQAGGNLRPEEEDTSGRIPTMNPRLFAENPRRYYMQQPEPQIPNSRKFFYMDDRGGVGLRKKDQSEQLRPTLPVEGRGRSIFDKALLVSMRRQPMGMVG
jgi:hypothetical protein